MAHKTTYLNLQQVLIVPFVIIITAAVFSTGFFAMRYSQRSILELGEQVSMQSAMRAQEQIKSYLNQSYATNLALKTAITSQLLPVDDHPKMLAFLQNLIRNSPTSGTVGFAYANGDYLGASHASNGNTLKKIASAKTGHVFQSIEISQDLYGSHENIVYQKPDYDARTRPWVTEAKAATGAVFSSVFALYSADNLGITLSEAIHDTKGDFVGVVGTDVVLDALDERLAQIHISNNSLIFIVDSHGNLISDNDPKSKRHGKLQNASQSANLALNSAFAYIQKHADSLSFNGSAQLAIGSQMRDYFISYQKYAFDDSLDWFVAVVTPERDFLMHISRIKQNMLLIWVVAFAVSLLIGLAITYLITHSIRLLQSKVATLNNGAHSQFEPAAHRIKEVNELSEAFVDMSQRLKETFGAIQKNNEMLEEKIAERTAELQRANSELFKLSHVDNLTQLANRRSLEEVLASNFAKLASGQQRDIAVLMCDIDYFKQYNDTYGHQQGDDCLQKVAKAIHSAVRASDVAARYGGEEFMVIMPGAALKNAMRAARAITAKVHAMALVHESSKVAPHVTLSIGIAHIRHEDHIGKDAALARADAALYTAKQTGRDRFVVYSESDDPNLANAPAEPAALPAPDEKAPES